MPKYGIEFVPPDLDDRSYVDFCRGLGPDQGIGLAGAPLGARRTAASATPARRARCTLEGARVRQVDFDAAGATVQAVLDDGGQPQLARDASSSMLAAATPCWPTKFTCKQKNPDHNSTALFGHFRGAERLPGRREGNISICWFEHGWFWFIPLADGTTSVGAVCWPYYLKSRADKPLKDYFLDTIALCPAAARPARQCHAGRRRGPRHRQLLVRKHPCHRRALPDGGRRLHLHRPDVLVGRVPGDAERLRRRPLVATALLDGRRDCRRRARRVDKRMRVGPRDYLVVHLPRHEPDDPRHVHVTAKPFPSRKRPDVAAGGRHLPGAPHRRRSGCSRCCTTSSPSSTGAHLCAAGSAAASTSATSRSRHREAPGRSATPPGCVARPARRCRARTPGARRRRAVAGAGDRRPRDEDEPRRRRRRAAVGARPRRRHGPLRRLSRLRRDQQLRAAAAVRCLRRPLPARRPRRRARDPVRRPPHPDRRQPRSVGADAEQEQRSTQRHVRPGGDLRDRPERQPRALAVGRFQAQARPPLAGARGDHLRAFAPHGRCHLFAQSQPRRPRLRRQLEPRLPRRPAVRGAPLPRVFLQRTAGIRDRHAAGVLGARRLCRLEGDDGVLAPDRRRLVGGVSALRRPARRGVCSESTWCGARTVTAGFGISWIFATSSQRVRTDD